MGDFSFLKGLSIFYNSAKNSNSTEENECVSDIDHYTFYQCCLIPAFVLSVLMAATKPRRQKLLSFLDGRPGLVYPMDTLTRSSRISYCCAFGATGFLVYQILINQQFAIYYTGTLAVKTLIAILSMLIYGMVFFPLFTSLALETALSYLLGSLYVWIFFVVQIYEVTECNFNEIGRAVLLTRALPSLLCLAYLSISMPVKFGIAIYHKKYFTPSLGEEPYDEIVEEIKASYQGKHVTNLLKKPQIVKASEGFVNTVMASVKGILDEWVYHNQNGFRYPTRLLSVMFVSGCVVYVIAVQFLSSTVPVMNNMLDEFEDVLKLLGPEDPNEGDDVTVTRATILIVYFFTNTLRVSVIVTVTISTIITILNIVHMVSSFRTNLFAMYKGDYSHIPSPSEKSAISLCIGSIKYAGFQVGYIVWAYVLITIVIFIICLVLAIVIKILLNGYTDWLVNKVLQLWPSLAIAIALFGMQWLLAKFLFLQDKGQYVRLDNRRFYFIFVYFMFFYNIFLGLVSCLLRILKAIAIGTLFLARLDNSTLPRKFEFFDPGFNAYQGYIHMEAAHTHPVVNVFLRLLVALKNSRKNQESGEKQIEMSDIEVLRGNGNCHFESTTARPVNVAARFQWFVTYTLLHNPTVRIYRKGIFQSLWRARKEGIKVPISDSPITDFDIVKALEERDNLRTEGANTTNPRDNGLSNGVVTVNCNHGSDEDDAMEDKQNKKITKKLNSLINWKKKVGNGSLPSVDDVSGDQKTTESYLRIQNV